MCPELWSVRSKAEENDNHQFNWGMIFLTRAIKLTIQVTFVNCLLMAVFGLFLTIVEWNIHYFFLVPIAVFFNTIIPTLLATVIFLLIENKLWQPDHLRGISLTGTLLTLIFILGLIGWSIIDVLVYGDGLTVDNLIKDLRSQFLGLSPLALSTGFALPLLNKRNERLTE